MYIKKTYSLKINSLYSNILSDVVLNESVYTLQSVTKLFQLSLSYHSKIASKVLINLKLTFKKKLLQSIL